MPFTLTMPKLSPTMEEGTIVKWHVKEGEYVNAGDLLIEVATDKATVEHTALDEGWLRQIVVNEGKNAIVNQPIAVMTVDEKESLEGYKVKEIQASAEIQDNKTESKEENQEKLSVSTPKGPGIQQPQFIPEPPIENYQFENPSEKLGKRILASPLAKKIAKTKGLDLSSIKGSGPNGRIMSEDLKTAQPSGMAHLFGQGIPNIAPGSYEEESLSQMRKVIGQRLQESKSFIPHFYVSQVFNAEPMVSLREELSQQQIKFTVNDFIVRACALALKQHPNINSGFNSVNQSIIHFQTIDIALAVSLEEGLITPIIRHADYKNIRELSVEIRSLAQKARDGKLQPTEFKGGSFTISNLGMYGVVDFQAIINPPQAAILAVSGIQDVPVVKSGQIVPGKTCQLTLSVDHRVIDGVAASKFLQTLKGMLEAPAFLLL
ncbi:MAG: pyruvate dehydrogenase complex dihydrolipoamide acetyltransferase [Parachlamydiaceae bacterium]|nr:pyruvate dehydrogenase complex dihydrolipoamide acetyltransferase [Parachlamydiaceae bacterium]